MVMKEEQLVKRLLDNNINNDNNYDYNDPNFDRKLDLVTAGARHFIKLAFFAK